MVEKLLPPKKIPSTQSNVNSQLGSIRMPHSIARIYIHLVFGTKLRLPLIQETVQKSLFSFMAGILNRMDCEPIRIGGVNDHVHLLFVLSRKYAISKIAEEEI